MSLTDLFVAFVPFCGLPEGCLESGGVAAAHHQWLGYLANVNAVGSIEPTFDTLDVVDIDDRRTMYPREVFCGQTFFPIP